MRAKFFITLLLSLVTMTGLAAADVTLSQDGNKCTIRNDYVSVYISEKGEITSFLRYVNNDRNFVNAVQLIEGTGVKGYFSCVSSGNTSGNIDISHFYVKQNSGDIVEVQYESTARDGLKWVIGYIVRRDVAGVYNYAILQGSGTPGLLNEARMGLRVSPALFNYAYVNDDVQQQMPTPEQMADSEMVTDATYKLADGTIYTKYDYAAFQKDDALHGLMGNNIAVWSISPSMEWINGGVMRQDLTVHATDTSPILLRHFHGNHFGGVGAQFVSGQQKLYGPHLLYVNTSTDGDVTAAHNSMIADAKAQCAVEQQAWPYNWMRDEMEPYVKQRGTVTGRISLGDDADYFRTTRFQVVLAQPGKKPMLQGEGYQFWAETDDDGTFTLSRVRPGSYSLWVYALNGSATGYYEYENVVVSADNNTALGTIVWTPERYGEILWQIGEADHLAAGYKLSDAKRSYSLYEKVPETLTFTIGESDATQDWYYAQAHVGKWNIKYQLDEVPIYPLRLTVATAGASNAKLTVSSNDNTNNSTAVFRPEHDGSVSRSATLAGRDSVFVVDIPVGWLRKGENTLSLGAWGWERGIGGIMYDCIKLERSSADAPAVISATAQLDFSTETTDNSAGITEVVSYNNTAFYLRGSNLWTMPVRVPGRDTRSFTFSDNTKFSGQNFATLKSQTKNDYSEQPAPNVAAKENNRLNIGFTTTVAGKIYIAFQSTSNPTEDSKLRLAMNGEIVAEASLPEAAAKSARCDVLEYEAEEGATFFIDSYGAASNIYCVRFVPDGPSAVQTVVPAAMHPADNVWYNLSGQRVSHPNKGMYIHNGRVVILK